MDDTHLAEALTNGNTSKPVELSISLPHSPGLAIQLMLNDMSRTLMLFVACQAIDAGASTPSMGSLVYAMPDRYNAAQPICTALYTTTASIDLATRLARLLAKKLEKPCYVGSSISLTTSPAASTVEEEMEAFKSIVQVVMDHAKAL